MRHRWVRGSGLLFALGLGAAVSACGSSSSTDGPAASSGSFTLAASPASASVQQGNSATVTISVTRAGGFSGPVTPSAGTLPTGVTASFSPSQVPGTATTASLTITVAATAAAGTYSIPVQGQGTGVANASTTVSLTVTAAPPPAGFQLSLASGTASAPQGGGATVGITVARSGSFTGPVNLALEGAPTGVSAAFSAAPIPSGSTTSTLTLNVAQNTAAGTYNLTVRGSATGLPDQTAALALTVTAVSPGSYTLSVAPATLSLQQGANGTAQVNIARTGGFTGAVSLAVTAPTGVTATLNPAQAGSGVNASTLSVAVASNVAAGNYSLTITGTAQGIANQTATLALTVTASGGGGGGGGGNLAWQFCNPSDLPLWFAFQDGTGAWTAVAAGANNTYSFSLANNRGGVAWVTPGTAANSFEVEIIYGTRTELTQLGTERCAATPATKTVNGTAVGLGQLDIALISLGTAATSVTGALGQNFSIQGVPDGTRDLFASRSNALSLAVDRLFLRRNVNYAAGSTITPAVDFGGNESFAPATQNVTLGNLGSELAALASSFYTANARSVGIMVNTTPSAGAAKTWPSLPTSQIQAGEFHLVVSTAVPFAGSANGRSAGRFLATPGATTLDFGPASTFGTPTVAASAPYARLRYQGTLQAEYGNLIIAGYTQANRSVSITTTSGYLGGTAYDVAMPDFAGVGTWNNTWGPAAGAATNWTFQAWAWTGTGPGGILGPPLADNATFRTGYKGGQITP